MIGVVGGLGPYAGLDLVRKVFDATPARRDQDHLPVTLLSVPRRVPDRTEYLLGHTSVNPGDAILGLVLQLVAHGAEVVGIPCNTAHARPIWDPVVSGVADRCELVHMVEEVAAVIRRRHPSVRRVGILATTGTLVARTYPRCLGDVGVEVIEPTPEVQERHVHPAIYDPDFGIKAVPSPPAGRAVEHLHRALGHLVERGAEVAILACTEIPLALTEAASPVPLIDATEALARALVGRSLGAADAGPETGPSDR